jgi:hypothetical protein
VESNQQRITSSLWQWEGQPSAKVNIICTKVDHVGVKIAVLVSDRCLV